MGFSWMSVVKSNRETIGFENGLLICVTHIGEEMLKTLLFYGTSGWVGEVVGNNVGNRKIRVLLA